jgi:hypothetical protein
MPGFEGKATNRNSANEVPIRALKDKDRKLRNFGQKLRNVTSVGPRNIVYIMQNARFKRGGWANCMMRTKALNGTRFGYKEERAPLFDELTGAKRGG